MRAEKEYGVIMDKVDGAKIEMFDQGNRKRGLKDGHTISDLLRASFFINFGKSETSIGIAPKERPFVLMFEPHLTYHCVTCHVKLTQCMAW